MITGYWGWHLDKCVYCLHPSTDSQHHLQFILPSMAPSDHEIRGETACSFPTQLRRIMKSILHLEALVLRLMLTLVLRFPGLIHHRTSFNPGTWDFPGDETGQSLHSLTFLQKYTLGNIYSDFLYRNSLKGSKLFILLWRQLVSLATKQGPSEDFRTP